MTFPAAQIRYYSPDYLTQRKYIEFHYFLFINYSFNQIEGTIPSMPRPESPTYYRVLIIFYNQLSHLLNSNSQQINKVVMVMDKILHLNKLHELVMIDAVNKNNDVYFPIV
jgi:hypothetical protein